MRKQCLFDPNHLIDEFGLTKHLLNCQSKLKKDWRKCRYSDSHWHLYNYIDFHQNYECPLNPLCIKDPKVFYEARQQQIRRRNLKSSQKNVSKVSNVLSQIQEDSRNQTSLISFSKQPISAINFGEISIIQGQNDLKLDTFHYSQTKKVQSNSILELHNALNLDDTANQQISLINIGQGNSSGENVISLISSQNQQMFEKGISKKQKQLWTEPSFQTFEKKFRLKWIAKRQNENQSHNIQEEKKEEHFEEEDEPQMTISDVHKKYDNIDLD